MLITPRPEAHVLLARRRALRIDARDLRAELSAGKGAWRIFDLRSEGAFARDHIEGAAHLELSRVARCRRFRRDRVNVFYGADADANAPYLSAWRLADAGYPAAVIEDGFAGWRAVTASDGSGEAAALFAVLRLKDDALV